MYQRDFDLLIMVCFFFSYFDRLVYESKWLRKKCRADNKTNIHAAFLN